MTLIENNLYIIRERRERLKRTYTGLLLIKERGPKRWDLGICGNLRETDTGGELDNQILGEWEEWSGNYLFPVPHHKLDPEDAFRRYSKYRIMWFRFTKYGRARRRLLDFLIKWHYLEIKNINNTIFRIEHIESVVTDSCKDCQS